MGEPIRKSDVGTLTRSDEQDHPPTTQTRKRLTSVSQEEPVRLSLVATLSTTHKDPPTETSSVSQRKPVRSSEVATLNTTHEDSPTNGAAGREVRARFSNMETWNRASSVTPASANAEEERRAEDTARLDALDVRVVGAELLEERGTVTQATDDSLVIQLSGDNSPDDFAEHGDPPPFPPFLRPTLYPSREAGPWGWRDSQENQDKDNFCQQLETHATLGQGRRRHPEARKRGARQHHI